MKAKTKIAKDGSGEYNLSTKTTTETLNKTNFKPKTIMTKKNVLK